MHACNWNAEDGYITKIGKEPTRRGVVYGIFSMPGVNSMSFSLQVGEAEPQEEVLMMCDDPTNQHFFKMKNYIELLELKERLLASLCDGKDKIIGSAHEFWC